MAETLSLSLSGCGDDLLYDLSIREVAPAPDASRLAVTVETLRPDHDPAAVLAALARAHGRLRCEVASALRRKRAPELVFRLAAPGEESP